MTSEGEQEQQPRPEWSVLVEVMEWVISPCPSKKAPPYWHLPKSLWIL